MGLYDFFGKIDSMCYKNIEARYNPNIINTYLYISKAERCLKYNICIHYSIPKGSKLDFTLWCKHIHVRYNQYAIYYVYVVSKHYVVYVCILIKYILYTCKHRYTFQPTCRRLYGGVATVSRIDQILSLLQGSFAKQTYSLIDPTNQSHPIAAYAEAAI